MTSASCVAVTIHLSVTVSLQNIDGRVSVGISPNSEILVRQCPIQGIVSSGLCPWEFLFIRLQGLAKTTYQEILVVEGLELEQILRLHIADMFVDILGRSSFCRENSQTHTRANNIFCTMHQVR